MTMPIGYGDNRVSQSIEESDIHHFVAQAKMASFSEEFSGEGIDFNLNFDRLSASCL